MEIILVPGLWLDGNAWRDVTPYLQQAGHHAIPVTLPGQGAGGDATLEGQVAGIVARLDAAPEPVLLVGHSAACSLVWMAADQRPDRVKRVVLIGGYPGSDGQTYADFAAVTDGLATFPGWQAFEGPDLADLDEAARAAIEQDMHPVSEAVVRGAVRLADERRHGIPVTMICPEFTPDQAKEWLGRGHMPELAAAQHIDWVDLDTGHWPMYSAPDELARVLHEETRRPLSAGGA